MVERTVRQERTGWRDQGLSERHRAWGWNCPAVDLDFLFLEYDRGKAVAIVEYKHETAQPAYPSHPTYQAMIDLGTRASVPVFGVRYANDYSWFRVHPLNTIAHQWLTTPEKMTERQWVAFLYRLRGYEVPVAVLDSLNTPL